MFKRKTNDERRENVVATLNSFLGKQSFSKRSKHGVSLITVLLFMLVATIAATATYKWITSEGHSSASRMLEREAYQSSVAGIENARSWMTYHANDVGALIRQYLNDNDRKPIKLTDRLRGTLKPGQEFDVWLTGVNTENSTYKVQILSSGKARGGTQHSEVAIFNVDGLYQVKVPQESHHSNIDFDFAYAGGSSGGTQSKFSSILINGNWQGNQGDYPDKFVITGNADLTGNHVNLGTLNCIGGGMSLGNQGITSGGLLYVGGHVTNAKFNLDSSAYFDGLVEQGCSTSNRIDIKGSVMLNGTLKTCFNTQDFWTKIGKNLCTSNEGRLLVYGNGNTNLKVEGNVWMPGIANIATDPSNPGADNYSSYDKIILGSGNASQVYIRTGHRWADYNSMRTSKTYVENKNHPRKCGAEYSYAYNGVENLNVHVCDNGGAEFWNGETYSPYANKANKDKLYYLYYMPDGVTDVSFDRYYDSYWKWCTKTGGAHCLAYDNGTWMNTYFVNFSAKSDGTAFTTSYHSQDANHTVNVGGNYYRYLNHNGNNATGSPYCKLASGKSWRPECGVTPWFKVDGTFSNLLPEESPFDCGEYIKEICDTYWEKKPGCDGADYFIDDPIEIPIATLESFAETSKACSGATAWNGTLVEELNSCYASIYANESERKEKLYNDYLVVKIAGGNNDISGTLKGKFVIIAEDKIMARNSMITAADDGNSFVLLYLKQGSYYLPTNDSPVKHVFIFMNEENETSDKSHINLYGTLYFPAAKCIKNDFADANLEVDKNLLQSLSDAGIVCNKGESCGSAPATGSATGAIETEIATNGTDAYYISMAPQLGVSLESQHSTTETLPSEDGDQSDLASSFILLPRIIYLPTDPYGKLSDYYNVVPLNGAKLTKAQVGVSDCGGIPTNDNPLYSGGTPLTEGIYECKANATEGDYESVPFWVVVKGSQRGTPTISFIEDSQEMGTTGTAEVHLSVMPHDQAITVTVACPDAPEGWNYTVNGGSRSAGTCTFEFPANNAGTQVVKVFDVSTTNAVNGTLTFGLQAGEGYALTWPYYSELHVSSSATLSRVEASQAEINSYCSEHPSDCPEEGHRGDDWPSCSTTETWVEPANVSFAVITRNDTWSISVGGTGEMTLGARPSNDCVVIIPTENNSIDKLTVEANSSYQLRATAKAKKRKVMVGFKGDVGDGKNPVLKISVNGRESACVYNDVKDDAVKACAVSVFSGEGISISIDKDNEENKNFSYWKCDNNGGTSCPTIDPITSQNYSEFTVKDDNAIVYAHFGESDKHCFFDEFKNGSVGCYSGGPEYCIDRCGDDANSTCGGAVDANSVFTNSKWHLVEGSLANIESHYGNISIDRAVSRSANRSGMDAVKVMSTVNAGIYGTLKALVQLPKATSSFGNSAPNIAKSGFMLRSNAAGSEYLMLNVYANQDGRLEVRLCRDGGTASCLLGSPVKNGNKASVGASSMVMMAATLTDDNKLSVSAFVGNFYGEPDEYTYVFDLSALSSNYGTRDHEFVGFSMADPNFKIYGIGWKSEDYDSECHDTYPTVKCSFAAVAPNGVVPTETSVKPWIGHSGWFDSRSYSCTESFYYYNGNDASCGAAGESGVTCPSTGYNFSESGAGQHGYVENGKDMKTAKAWLKCSLSPEDGAWAVETEAERAHCGPFWTGKFTECTDHADLANVPAVSSGEERTLTLEPVTNLRGSTLKVSMQNSDNNEIEIWLLSENANWGADDFASRSVKFKGNSGSFEVASSFADGAQGFDPEHVKQIVIRNLGGSSVTDVAITSACKNAVGISNCVAQYNDGTGKWTITADVTNKDKVTAYSVEGTVDGSSVIGISDAPSWTLDQAKWEKTDNPYGNYQGKTFKFTASVTNQGGTVLSTQCNDVAITSVSCSNLSASDVESGAAWPQLSFKLNNCPNNRCVYTIKLDGTDAISGQEGYGTISKTASGNAPECNTDGGCEHTYTVVSANAEVPFNECSRTFKVKKKVTTEVTATCSVSGSLYQGQTIQLDVSNITNINNNVDMVWSLNGSIQNIKCDATHCWANTMNAPTTAETYSYSLTYNGNTVCTGSVDIGPALTCSVTPTTLGKGEDYTFTANGNLHCWNCSFTDASGSVENNLEVQKNGTLTKTKTANNTGDKTLTLACNSCDNNISASCSTPLTINAAAPVFSCPTNQSVTVGNTVSITPQGLAGCEDGCSYTIAETSVTGSGYTGGALPGFTGPSASGTQSYTVSLTNSVGSTEHECRVEFTEGSSGGCHCADYCGSGCEGSIITGNVSNENFTGCVFFTSATRINVNAADAWTINGWHENIKPSDNGCWDNPANCANFLANHGITAVDEGYYFRGNGVWVELQTTGSNPCGGATLESVGKTNHRQTYTADKWYSITMHQNGKFVIQNHTENSATISYKDCNGTEKSKTIAAGQGGDEGEGNWWNKVEDSVSQNCVIYFKYPNGGDFDMQVW